MQKYILSQLKQRSTDSSGFTLIELLVVIIILGAIAMVGASILGGFRGADGAYNLNEEQRANAWAQANAFATAQPGFKVMSCSPQETSYDTYVSCSISSGSQVFDVQCPYKLPPYKQGDRFVSGCVTRR